MAELRETLIAAGWRQGVILDPPSLQQAGIEAVEGSIGFLVLTQTCDCINPDFGKEPYLELLPLVLRDGNEGKPDPNFENGKNPREIHFWVTLRGEPTCVVSRIKDIRLVDRKRIEEFRFSEDVGINRAEVDDIVQWRAERYLRTAFPEAFEAGFRSIAKRFSAVLARNHDAIDSLRIFLSPLGEIQEGEGYEIHLRLMVTPAVMGQPGTIESLHATAKELETLFATCDSFASAKCSVSSLAEITLWEARGLLDFSRYDYLSFGKEESCPEG